MGWKFKSPWYLTANLYFYDGDLDGFGLGLGYSIFGGK